MSDRTTVISVRGLSIPDRAALVADPGFVYCGRAFAGWPGSIFGNPFKGNGAADRFRDELQLAIDCSNYSRHDFVAMAEVLHTLRGKRLGCWCGCWSPGQPDIGCHAVALAELADAAGGPTP